jgi:hypothetical protein
VLVVNIISPLGYTERVLGSTVRDVVLAAPCPALIVPDVDPHERKSLFDELPAPRTPGLS